ncbi:hypothetical protein AX15_007703 [Amanita polypyramis BW_CC]|nr:hypothetical protein AX15_007703 [Amanita polypyramis BW_CC]
MDVPFPSSGALSRRHYALVRTIESSTSAQEANNILRTEIRSLRTSMSHTDLTLAQCMEFLVLLLYCFNAVDFDFSPGLMDFALPHAINLAEAGKTIEQKKIGYCFCAELMRLDNEMQLMLVNTLRKDLESTNIARICLALESLIAAPTEHVVPAVQPRLQDLLSHNSPQVRRRAIHACRILSKHERNLLSPMASILLKRLKDPDHTVINAALSVMSSVFRDVADAEQLSKCLEIVLQLAFDDDCISRPNVLNAFSALSLFSPLTENIISRLCDCVRRSSRKRNFAILRATFCLVSSCTAEQLRSNFNASPVSYIRDLLVSDDPNLHYVFLVCLGFLDAGLWSGSMDGYPSILDNWEVEKIMRFIDSPDALIRTKTLTILMEVDQGILDAIYIRLLQSLSPDADSKTRDEYVVRLLEVVKTKAVNDGGAYARYLVDLFTSFEGVLGASFVSEVAVENVLSYLQYSDQMLQIQCAGSLLTMVTERESHFGPTILVVISAVSTQYCTLVSIPPAKILSGIGSRLPDAPPSVQDACILAMLRLAADCEVSSEVGNTIARVHDNAGRYIRKRCKLFQSLFQEKDILLNIIRKSQGPSLPDFLKSLESYESQALHTPHPKDDIMTLSRSRSSSLSRSKLRYEAYDAPRLTPKLREFKSLQGLPDPRNDSEVRFDTLEPGLADFATSATLIAVIDISACA